MKEKFRAVFWKRTKLAVKNILINDLRRKNTRVTDVIHKRASDILESRKNGREKRKKRKRTLSCIISPVEVIYDESLMALYGTGLVLSY